MNFMNEIKNGIRIADFTHTLTRAVCVCVCVLMVKQQNCIYINKTCVISIINRENFCNQIDRFCTNMVFHVGTNKKTNCKTTTTTAAAIIATRRGEEKEKQLKYGMHQLIYKS